MLKEIELTASENTAIFQNFAKAILFEMGVIAGVLCAVVFYIIAVYGFYCFFIKGNSLIDVISFYTSYTFNFAIIILLAAISFCLLLIYTPLGHLFAWLILKKLRLM